VLLSCQREKIGDKLPYRYRTPPEIRITYDTVIVISYWTPLPITDKSSARHKLFCASINPSGGFMTRLFCVPPSPEVMSMLFMDYRRSGAYKKMTFPEYLASVGYTDPAEDFVGMDDNARFRSAAMGPQLIDVPAQPVTGKVSAKVLLVDFPDRPGVLLPQHYEDLLFSKNIYPSGSVRDYYAEVSLGKVEVQGSVHGWLRMPQPYSYYTNGESGTKWNSYPHNAPRLAEDAVNVALQSGIQFDPGLDKFNQGIITALIIVHAGRGAEVMPPALRGGEIWSHKWILRNPVNVAENLAATIYLIVPNDCKAGVCAHELGHLAFQWQDFYDPNYDEDGKEWDGSGLWDLMAGGSYNGNGARPAHPAALHKLQHGWIKSTVVKKSRSITLKPYTSKYGRTYKLMSPSFKPKQYLLLENRSRSGFDFNLPGEGLLVWRVDESGEQEASDQPGLCLVQADGKHNLEDPDDWNQGDAGDPFPGSQNIILLKDIGTTSTSFPEYPRSGITLQNIRHDPITKVIQLYAKFSSVGPSPVKRSTPSKSKRSAATKNSGKLRRRVRRRKK
jgi:immune inhibitor A